MLSKYHNISQLDRTLRILLGVGLLYLGFVRGRGLDAYVMSDIALGLAGFAIVIAATLKVCPAYLMLRRSTYKAAKTNNIQTYQEVITNSDNNRNLIKKLQLSIVIPTTIVIVIFSLFIFDLNHKLVMQKITKNAEVASDIIQTFFINPAQHSDANDSKQSVDTAGLIVEDSIAGVELLLHHDQSGQLLPLRFEKGVKNQALLSAALNKAAEFDQSTQNNVRDMIAVNEQSYVISSTRVEGSDAWLTSVVKSPATHGMFELLVSSKFVVNVLLVLLMGLWSSSYIINSFITKADENAEMLHYLATHDALTKLPNRRLINTIVQDKIDQIDATTQCVTLYKVDVVGFRDINDTLGTTLGDELLVKLSDRLKTIEPDKTDVVRMGADVFCLVCTHEKDQNQTQAIANSLHEQLEANLSLNGVPIVVQARLGISTFPDHSSEPEELVRFANIALAQAKNQNSATCYYHNDFDTHSVRKLTLLARLSSAIENDELTLVYQPKLDLKQSQIVGVEVLVRWHDAEYGHISPFEFVNWAEKSGLINNLTHWVLIAAEKQCALWQAQGCKLPFAINLSPTNLYDRELVPLVTRLLATGSFSTSPLELELTEDAVMEDPEKALQTMTLLSNLGVTFAIDDFGTGHSSFAYLQKFPVKNLKIDRAFIKDIDQNDHDAVLARSMINLGHELDCVVTGEGVEDIESLEKLQSFGCDHIQGYYISKPLAADDFIRWYDEGQFLPKLAA